MPKQYASDYELMSEKGRDTICQYCNDNKYMFLLINHKTKSKLPSFYICFRCGTVSEVGIGEIIKKEVV